MKTVIRHDRAALRRPEATSQGFLRVEGYASRAGIYEYRNDDGSPRYELRPREEVSSPEALASFDAASVTLGHPPEEVTADNVRRHEVGTASAGRMDGDLVAVPFTIKDARAIKRVRAGTQELSPGYRIDLDETPGLAPEYATPANPTGRYHAVQRNIRVNHLAIVARARGGEQVRIRMDATEVRRDEEGRLTSIANGHQHLVEMVDCHGQIKQSGCTTWTLTEGAEQGHSRDWIRNNDGTITIGLAEGHSHVLLETGAPAPLPQLEIDRSGSRTDSGRMAQPTMDADEQIRSLKAQLADAVARLRPIETTASNQQARADQAEARIVTLTQENTDLRAQIASAQIAIETEALKRERHRADAAEATLREEQSRFDSAVDARVELERKAAIVMGPEFVMRGMPERQIITTVVKRLDAQADTSPKVSDAFLRGRFESLIEMHGRNARSLQTLGAAIVQPTAQRDDSLERDRERMRNWGSQPLPNSREARDRAGRGA